jgi:hypothetical protein
VNGSIAIDVDVDDGHPGSAAGVIDRNGTMPTMTDD